MAPLQPAQAGALAFSAVVVAGRIVEAALPRRRKRRVARPNSEDECTSMKAASASSATIAAASVPRPARHVARSSDNDLVLRLLASLLTTFAAVAFALCGWWEVAIMVACGWAVIVIAVQVCGAGLRRLVHAGTSCMPLTRCMQRSVTVDGLLICATVLCAWAFIPTLCPLLIILLLRVVGCRCARQRQWQQQCRRRMSQKRCWRNVLQRRGAGDARGWLTNCMLLRNSAALHARLHVAQCSGLITLL
jgi:hypothetical protein